MGCAHELLCMNSELHLLEDTLTLPTAADIRSPAAVQIPRIFRSSL